MLQAKDKFTIITTVIVSAILGVVLASTVMLAAFSATRTATTTITFANGVELEVTGINANKWTTTGTSTTPQLDEFSFDAIGVKVKSGAESLTVYVRLFAIVWTDANATNAPLASLTKNETNGKVESSYTTKENEAITAAGPNYSAIAVTTTFNNSNASTAQTLLNQYTPYSSFATVGEHIQGKFIKGLVIVYATNEQTTTAAGWNNVSSYSFTSLMPA